MIQFAGAIERGEVALKIVRVDDVVGVLEEFAIALFAFSDRGFCSAVFRDVSRDSDNTQHVVAFIGQW